MAFLTVPFWIYSTLVVKLVVQEWGVYVHKMQVFWSLMFVATVVYSADEREFLDTLAKKRAMETPAIPRSHGRTPSGKIDCRVLGGDISKLSAKGEKTQELFAHEYHSLLYLI